MMFRKRLTSAILVAAAISLLGNSPLEAQVFNFFSGGEILAQLELSTLPAAADDITSLTFTPAGELQFGLGMAYDGTFDTTFGALFADGNGLAGNEVTIGRIVDQTPEESSTLQPLGTMQIQLLATTIPTGDVFQLTDTAGDSILVGGDFLLVPEPSFGLIPAVLTLFMTWRKQLRS